MLTVDTVQGAGRDYAELWKGEDQEDPIRLVIEFSLEDEGEVSFRWVDGKKAFNLYVPQQRLRELFASITDPR